MKIYRAAIERSQCLVDMHVTEVSIQHSLADRRICKKYRLHCGAHEAAACFNFFHTPPYEKAILKPAESYSCVSLAKSQLQLDSELCRSV